MFPVGGVGMGDVSFRRTKSSDMSSRFPPGPTRGALGSGGVGTGVLLQGKVNQSDDKSGVTTHY